MISVIGLIRSGPAFTFLRVLRVTVKTFGTSVAHDQTRKLLGETVSEMDNESLSMKKTGLDKRVEHWTCWTNNMFDHGLNRSIIYPIKNHEGQSSVICV